MNQFRQAEQGFDKLFNYNRQRVESFDYCNVMKNETIFEQLKQQEQEFQSHERKIEVNQGSNQEHLLSINIENKETNNSSFNTENYIDRQRNNNIFSHPSGSQESNLSFGSFISLRADFSPNPNILDEQIPKPKKKKKKSRRL